MLGGCPKTALPLFFWRYFKLQFLDILDTELEIFPDISTECVTSRLIQPTRSCNLALWKSTAQHQGPGNSLTFKPERVAPLHSSRSSFLGTRLTSLPLST